MTNQIELLYQKSRQDEKLIIGLMSGTSMDGLDIGLCRFQNSGLDTKVELLQFKTAKYTDEFRAQLKSIFSKKEVDLEMVCLMNEQVARVHAQLVNEALSEWNYQNHEIDFIASHGQTIYHAPRTLHHHDNLPNGTLQIGDGDHLATITEIITLSDFRQKHIAAGGEGAPLALYADYILFSIKGEERILLNIGGISNFTYLPADLDTSRIFSSDVGPGNTIMDQYVQKYFPGMFYDEEGRIAQKGQVNLELLNALMADDFFELSVPKTTGPELFSLAYLEKTIESLDECHLSHEDIMVTLCNFTAKSIAIAIKNIAVATPITVYQSGGGLHNPVLQHYLKQELVGVNLLSTEATGINPDAKEAILFALLANETLTGNKIDFKDNTRLPKVCMGKISLPK